MGATVSVMEYTAANERYYDYCLWEYRPLKNPENQLKSLNLLTNSFRSEGVLKEATKIMRAIQSGFGHSCTVWGIKQEGEKICWELYFYDYAEIERTRSVSQLLAILSPWNACAIHMNEQFPYFMFSIDFQHKHFIENALLENVQVYLVNAQSTVPSGICYEMKKTDIALKNFYFFFDAKSQMTHIVDKIRSSIFLDCSLLDIHAILWPDLVKCQTIVVANKRTCDGIYFSRINIDQLIFFLKEMRYPTEQISFVENHKSKLDHLLYDVGFDYWMENGQIKILKSSYYGVF